MLDPQLFSASPDVTLDQLKRRGVPEETLSSILDVLKERSRAITHTEALRKELNQATQTIALAVRAKDTSLIEANKDRLRALKADIKAAEEAQARGRADFDSLMLALPNLPASDVPEGADESANREERRVGEPKAFDFEPLDHTTLGERLGLLSFAQGAQVSGARFVVMRNVGAKLERALAAFMLDTAQAAGCEEIAPPLLVRPECMQGAGQYPKFKGESFETIDGELVLIPTSEVPLVNLHRDEIMASDALPKRMTAYTPCFRREAGSAGRDTRGLIRLHQFSKVELVSITTPDQSNEEHERITRNAEMVLQKLGLPYRVVTLCTGDLGFAATKTYDLEVWLPYSRMYREISSCSNCGDFQARRAGIRYRDGAGKPQFVHTLNGSGVAVGRALVAVLENYQQADGSVVVPEALRPYMGGLERIG